MTTARRATPNRVPRVSRATRDSPETKDRLAAEVPRELPESAATKDVPARRARGDRLARVRARDRRACRVCWD